jgi:phosphonate degradation associated HDIG domain protein
MSPAASSDSIIDLIADIFERRGSEAYLGEAVTMAEHMLQTATLARASGAPDELIVAALLHDIGHFTSELGAYSPADADDNFHEEAGAKALVGHFPPLVIEAIRLHVAAKRYLCAVESAYHDGLSAASKHSLALQGGPMTSAEVAAFERLPFHAEAVMVRRWDDCGKVAGLAAMTFAECCPLLRRVAI